MAKKTSKMTRSDRYREILESYGKRLEDCEVLAFVFKYQMEIELFHFCLMAEKPVYFLFDSFEKYAYVIAPQDEKNTAVISAIAAKNGGEKITPNLR